MIHPAATPAITAFLSGSAGTTEWLLLFGVILILFGPRRLPEIARTVGRWILELRRAANDFRDQIMSLDVTADEPPEPSRLPPMPSLPAPPGGVPRATGGTPAAPDPKPVPPQGEAPPPLSPP